MPSLFDNKFSHWDILVYFVVLVVVIIMTRVVAPRHFDKVVAVASVGSFIAFLVIVGLWVDSISLKIVLMLSGLMALYDFWLDAFTTKKNGNGNNH